MIMSAMMAVFLIALLGYGLGCIRICNISLGTSGVLLVALVFGHYGYVVPSDLQSFGLLLFVCAVGFIAGPVFFDNFKHRAFSYIVLGFVIIVTGAALAVILNKVQHVPAALTAGMLSGALTSTPALATAIEATGGNELATIGYGIAYPFGILGVVLFIQLVPKLLKIDIGQEAGKLDAESGTKASIRNCKEYRVIDSTGNLTFALATVLGLVLGSIRIPLPGNMEFSLGNSGGPLIVGLLFGHFRCVGSFSIEVPKKTLEVFRELGLMLFLMGAGSGAGQGFVEVISEYGWSLFISGAAVTLVPMLAGYFIARKICRLEIFNCLGSLCGGMTSTPALGSLIDVAKTDNVAAAYAATYPVALITVVIATQIVLLLAG